MKCLSSDEALNVSLKRLEGKESHQEHNRNFVIKIHIGNEPGSVTSNSAKLKNKRVDIFQIGLNVRSDEACWSWDKFTGTCLIRLPDNNLTTEIIIKKLVK